jgi:hypothetical protein
MIVRDGLLFGVGGGRVVGMSIDDKNSEYSSESRRKEEEALARGRLIMSYYAKPPLKVRLKNELVFWLQMLAFAFVFIMSIDLFKFVDGKKWEYYNWYFVLGCVISFIIYCNVSETNKEKDDMDRKNKTGVWAPTRRDDEY